MGIADKISGKKVSQTRFFKEAKEKAVELAKDPDKLPDLVKKAQEMGLTNLDIQGYWWTP